MKSPYQKAAQLSFRRTGDNRHGVAALEFAITAPALFFVVFCCAEFARMSMMRDLASCAAYEAARTSIVEGATVAEAVEEAERVLARLGTAGATVNVNDGVEIDFSTNEIDVAVEIPMEQNAFFFPLFYRDRHITAECTMKTERYKGYYSGQ